MRKFSHSKVTNSIQQKKRLYAIKIGVDDGVRTRDPQNHNLML